MNFHFLIYIDRIFVITFVAVDRLRCTTEKLGQEIENSLGLLGLSYPHW